MVTVNNVLLDLLDIALGYAKDKALHEAIIKVQYAQREYLKAEADAKREKESAIIQTLGQYDISKYKLEREFLRLKSNLSPEAVAHFLKLFEELDRQRQSLVNRKRNISQNASRSIPITEKGNSIQILPGDVIAASRKAGLYEHYAVYIGNQRVIHYAAENGDFSGRITIHEAPFSEFKGDSQFIYVLDFPDNSGHPSKRWVCTGAAYATTPVSWIFDLIRKTSYHLYSPEETIERAKSRLGEEKYMLPFNNCEHFAIWCKTGVHESYQVEQWLDRIAQFAHLVISPTW